MEDTVQAQLVRDGWAGLTDDVAGSSQGLPTPLELTGRPGQLVSRFAVEETAVACVGVALLAAARLHGQRGGRLDVVTLNREHVAAAVRSERFFSRSGQSVGVGFAALSRFWPAADGWVRTHANYPWHRDALLDALDMRERSKPARGTPDEVDAVGASIAERRALDIEERVFAAGGIAAAVRGVDDWRAHPQGQALAAEPLVAHRTIGDAAPRTRTSGELPASGIRVLDLTRVIAGPVCTRYLAALGAEVLRIDPPQHPDMARGEVSDTLLGKRSALLDLRSPAGVATLHELLARADAVVCGYRPGALDRFGLTEDALAKHHPGVVVVYLGAWGHSGPWRHRRGFDSVVQAPTGIAIAESVDRARPGALPCQLLDHGTGYLAAAAVLDALHRQGAQGGTHIRRLSLARTAAWLTSNSATEPRPAATAAESVGSPSWLGRIESAGGPLTAVTPPGELDGRPLRWLVPPTGYGNDAPAWSL